MKVLEHSYKHAGVVIAKACQILIKGIAEYVCHKSWHQVSLPESLKVCNLSSKNGFRYLQAARFFDELRILVRFLQSQPDTSVAAELESKCDTALPKEWILLLFRSLRIELLVSLLRLMGLSAAKQQVLLLMLSRSLLVLLHQTLFPFFDARCFLHIP